MPSFDHHGSHIQRLVHPVVVLKSEWAMRLVEDVGTRMVLGTIVN